MSHITNFFRHTSLKSSVTFNCSKRSLLIWKNRRETELTTSLVSRRNCPRSDRAHSSWVTLQFSTKKPLRVPRPRTRSSRTTKNFLRRWYLKNVLPEKSLRRQFRARVLNQTYSILKPRTLSWIAKMKLKSGSYLSWWTKKDDLRLWIQSKLKSNLQQGQLKLKPPKSGMMELRSKTLFSSWQI